MARLSPVKAAIGERAYVPLGALAGTGVSIDYDPVSNDLRLQVDPGKRAPRSISAVGTPQEASPAFAVQVPALADRMRQVGFTFPTTVTATTPPD